MVSAVICMSPLRFWHLCNLPCVYVLLRLISIARYAFKSPRICFRGTKHEVCCEHVAYLHSTLCAGPRCNYIPANFFRDIGVRFLRPLRNSSGIVLGSRARLHVNRPIAHFLRWYNVSFDKCLLWFSINFTMEDSLNVDSFDNSLLFSLSFTMEGSSLGDRS